MPVYNVLTGTGTPPSSVDGSYDDSITVDSQADLEAPDPDSVWLDDGIDSSPVSHGGGLSSGPPMTPAIPNSVDTVEEPDPGEQVSEKPPAKKFGGVEIEVGAQLLIGASLKAGYYRDEDGKTVFGLTPSVKWGLAAGAGASVGVVGGKADGGVDGLSGVTGGIQVDLGVVGGEVSGSLSGFGGSVAPVPHANVGVFGGVSAEVGYTFTSPVDPTPPQDIFEKPFWGVR